MISKIKYNQGPTGKKYGDVLEMACGTGRFTELLMQDANSVIASDLVPEFVSQCKLKFAPMKYSERVTFLAGDARALSFPPASFDVIFWSWLMMYFADAEVAPFLRMVETWLRPGGSLVFREAVAGDDKSYDAYETSGERS